MEWVTKSLFIALLTVSSTTSAKAEPASSVDTRVLELQPRIQGLKKKGAQALTVYFEVIDRKGGYRVYMPEFGEGLTPELRNTFLELYFAASWTKGVSEAVCLDERTRALCGNRFAPAWLLDPKNAQPTYENLRAWTQETEVALQPMWEGLCSLASAKFSRVDYCTTSKT